MSDPYGPPSAYPENQDLAPGADAPAARTAGTLLITYAIISTVFAIIAVVLGAGNVRTNLNPDQIAELEAAGINPDTLGTAAAGAGLLCALIFAALFVTVGIFCRKQHKWALITGIVLASILLLFNLFGLIGVVQMFVEGQAVQAFVSLVTTLIGLLLLVAVIVFAAKGLGQLNAPAPYGGYDAGPRYDDGGQRGSNG